jgi:hypothetical protein
LFGLKKVISQKEKEKPIKAFAAPHTPKNFNTQRDSFMHNNLDLSNEDDVKISMKGESPPHELDMAPYF